MSHKALTPLEPVAERELATSRVIAAPPKKVFRAFSDPARLARWWGPNGFTNTIQEFNLRPGGHWRFVMHGPDGTDFPNESIFGEVVAPERVVFRHVSSPQFEMTITFEEYEGQTLVAWSQLFNTVEECRRVAKFAVAANEQNLDRLVAEVAGR